MNGMWELLNKDEPLNPILRHYIRESSAGTVLHHPVLIELPYFPKLNAYINARFAAKTEAIAQAIAERKWFRMLVLHERPYRLDAFMEHRSLMTDKEYWGCIGYIWTDSENIYENHEEWRSIWESPRPEKQECMDVDERVVLDNLPEVVTIYRGVNGKGASERNQKKGMSWTLDRKKAEWFSKRNNYHPQMVWEGVVKKSDIHAYFGKEREIVATVVK